MSRIPLVVALGWNLLLLVTAVELGVAVANVLFFGVYPANKARLPRALGRD